MKTFCAPDLPFWETVLWQAKQVGAALVLVGLIGAIVFVGYLILERVWK